MRFTVLTCVLGLLAIASPAHAQVSPVLQPSNAWNIDYAENECRLLRTFGNGEQALTLRLARGGNTGSVDIVLAGPAIPKLPTRLAVEMKLDPQGPTQAGSGYSMAIPSGGGRFVRWYDADLSVFEQANPNQIVQISSGKNFSARLNLATIHEALKALDTCYADLLQSWGVGPEDIAFLLEAQNRSPKGSTEITARRIDLPKPKGNPGAWVTDMDYPTEALEQEQSGDVTVALIVGTDGHPIACHVVVSSKVPALDLATCRTLQARASYSPPKDAGGKPRVSTRIERIRWMIPIG